MYIKRKLQDNIRVQIHTDTPHQKTLLFFLNFLYFSSSFELIQVEKKKRKMSRWLRVTQNGLTIEAIMCSRETNMRNS